MALLEAHLSYYQRYTISKNIVPVYRPPAAITPIQPEWVTQPIAQPILPSPNQSPNQYCNHPTNRPTNIASAEPSTYITSMYEVCATDSHFDSANMCRPTVWVHYGQIAPSAKPLSHAGQSVSICHYSKFAILIIIMLICNEVETWKLDLHTYPWVG